MTREAIYAYICDYGIANKWVSLATVELVTLYIGIYHRKQSRTQTQSLTVNEPEGPFTLSIEFAIFSFDVECRLNVNDTIEIISTHSLVMSQSLSVNGP